MNIDKATASEIFYLQIKITVSSRSPSSKYTRALSKKLYIAYVALPSDTICFKQLEPLAIFAYYFLSLKWKQFIQRKYNTIIWHVY